MPGAWTPDLAAPKPGDSICECDDPACRINVIAEAGVRELGRHAGFSYDDLNAHQRVHYKVIVADVHAAMSQATLDTGTVREVAADE